MSQSDAPRPGIAAVFLGLPVALGLLLLLSLGLLAVFTYLGGGAGGDRLEIRFVSDCGPASMPILEARIEAIGLGDPVLRIERSEVILVATMPGLPDDSVTMPALLARPGTLRVLAADQILATEENLQHAVVRLDEGGMPYTLLEFDASIHRTIAEAVDAERTLSIEMDGALVAGPGAVPPMTDGELRMPPGTGETRALLRRATDRAIVLDSGPLPCPVQVGGVGPAP